MLNALKMSWVFTVEIRSPDIIGISLTWAPYATNHWKSIQHYLICGQGTFSPYLWTEDLVWLFKNTCAFLMVSLTVISYLFNIKLLLWLMLRQKLHQSVVWHLFLGEAQGFPVQVVRQPQGWERKLWQAKKWSWHDNNVKTQMDFFSLRSSYGLKKKIISELWRC